MSGLCKDCKFWHYENHWHRMDEGVRPKRGWCKLITWLPHTPEPENDEAVKAYPRPYFADGAALLTKPDFGCVQFEAKES